MFKKYLTRTKTTLDLPFFIFDYFFMKDIEPANINQDGDVLLKPIAFVDPRDDWFFSPEMRKNIQKAEEEIQKGQGKEFKTAAKAM